MLKAVLDSSMGRYIALIERDDGSTYEQYFDDLEDLCDLQDSLGSYYIVQIY